MENYKLEFDKAFNVELEGIAKSKTLAPEANNISDVVRRAVALYKYLHTEVDSKNLRVALLDKNNKIVQVIEKLP